MISDLPRHGSAHVGALRWIDSHAHLASEAFSQDLSDVLQRTKEAGGEGVICIGESLAAAERARSIAAANPGFIWWTAGIHPHDAQLFNRERDEPAIRKAISDGAVAVGECGLDYHYDHSPGDQQREAFDTQLTIARDLGVPVVVHTREAEDDTAAMVREAGGQGVRGVLHCYTGSHKLAEIALEAGWSVSFSGIVTFKKWDDLELIRMIPEDRLLIESDSPYLAPVPRRGKRNEPAWCAYTLQKIAEIRSADEFQLSEQILANTRSFFKLA